MYSLPAGRARRRVLLRISFFFLSLRGVAVPASGGSAFARAIQYTNKVAM